MLLGLAKYIANTYVTNLIGKISRVTTVDTHDINAED